MRKKRYWVFCYDEQAKGGMNDFSCDFNSKEEADAYADHKILFYDYVDVYDSEKDEFTLRFAD